MFYHRNNIWEIIVVRMIRKHCQIHGNSERGGEIVVGILYSLSYKNICLELQGRQFKVLPRTFLIISTKLGGDNELLHSRNWLEMAYRKS